MVSGNRRNTAWTWVIPLSLEFDAVGAMVLLIKITYVKRQSITTILLSFSSRIICFYSTRVVDNVEQI